MDDLIDDLWGARAPETARSSLHNLVAILRRALAGAMETTPHGYALSVDDDQIDVRRFERLVANAREEAPAEKVRTLDRALGLWRGLPFVDVRYEDFAQIEIRRLEDLHLAAVECLLGAKIDLGFGEAVLPELQVLIDRFPLRERLRMQLMLALHLSGRSVEALATYAAWSRLLAAEWGLEPGPEMNDLRSLIRTRRRPLIGADARSPQSVDGEEGDAEAHDRPRDGVGAAGGHPAQPAERPTSQRREGRPLPAVARAGPAGAAGAARPARRRLHDPRRPTPRGRRAGCRLRRDRGGARKTHSHAVGKNSAAARHRLFFPKLTIWGRSSGGRAPRLQRGGVGSTPAVSTGAPGARAASRLGRRALACALRGGALAATPRVSSPYRIVAVLQASTLPP
jgi:DNA-binding SARP family transcriptional activator